MLNNTNNPNSFVDVLLSRDPVEQSFSSDPLGEMLFGAAIKKKAWGLTNKQPLYMGNSYETQLITEAAPSFQTDSDRKDIYANITPVSQTARIKFGGLYLERLRELSGDQYLQGEQELVRNFQKQLMAVLYRHILSTKRGRICYIYNAASSATAYCYGLGSAILEDQHSLWDFINEYKKYDICNTSTGAIKVSNTKLTTIDPEAGTVVMDDGAIDLSGTVGTYYLRPYQPALQTTSTAAVAFSGIQDWISSDAAYLTDSDGTAITNATYGNWRSIIKDFGGAVLDEEVMDYLISCCKGPKSGIRSIIDPAVLSKANKAAGARKMFVNVPDNKMGFIKTYYVSGDTTMQLMSSELYRGFGYVDLVNVEHLMFMHTLLKPTFRRPSFQLLEDTYEYINDVTLTGEFFTNKRNANARGTGLAFSSF